ncbi:MULTISPECIES: EAL domain-containing protein [Alteromonadaceae]|jgi:EAL and modified HD-GYP domain-containing signal transduction protein|uniref:EAL domain-containing protein n=1 Tax=Brumicola blandensis TaxID=3075611 RepID=A0AAW8R2S2_9ALTE|nr:MULTISPECIES: EAL domain-containing protein [unclassified Alteromonas]MDT0582398.1 EAL domain-containing protein [Alteromonas sp. W409]MDT0628620.1 EAL domain-containing protein [Alteromonas sp. W364]
MFAYVARQAIYNVEKRVFAYELLFRDGDSNCFPDMSPDEATSNMIATSHLSIGIEDITFNKPAFINFHRDTLLYRFPSTLDPLSVVIEIVETVEVNDELVQACKHIRNLGYQLALDDYDFGSRWDVFLPFVDYIKVEVEEIEKQGPAAVAKIQQLNSHGIKIIAEKVETHEQFERFKDMGVKLFQGYFLARPEMIRHRDLNASLHSVTELVSLSNSPNFDVKEVTKVIERDVGLAYKLMRFVNNPLINKRQKIESLQHALNYMGHIEIKKFIALLALANLRGEKPGELLIQSLVRARFCSLMSVELELPENPPSSFILGLFSMLDALLDQPMESLVQKLPVGAELQDALCHKNKDSNMGLQLRACYAFEEANWDEIDYIAAEFELTGERLYTLYYEAMHWAQNMSTSLI